jgi:cysteine sulfinate desulfinase
VIDATHQFYSLSAGNVHRSQFAEAQRLTARYEAARDRVAACLMPRRAKYRLDARHHRSHQYGGAKLCAPRLQPGDEIIVSEAEHHANLVPWLMVAEQPAPGGQAAAGRRFLPDVERLTQLITPRSRILASGRCRTSPAAARTWPGYPLAHAAGMVVMVDGARGGAFSG